MKTCGATPRRAAFILALSTAACQSSPPPDTGPVTSTTAPTTEVPSVLSLSDAVTCTAPEARLERFYDRTTLPEPAVDDYGLRGAGVVAEDFDGDGQVDLFIVGQDESQLWLNTTNEGQALSFVDETPQWLEGVDLLDSVGAVGVDLIPDGRPDLVITRFDQPNRLLENTGTRFVDRTPSSWTSAWKTQTAALDDTDGDGDLDLFFGNYGELPTSNVDIQPSEPSELYRNDGAGAWSDQSHTLPQAVHDGYVFMAGFYRMEDNHRPDLFVFNDFGRAYSSQRLTFTGPPTIEAESWHSNYEDMGVGVGDVNADSVPDFLITSAATISVFQSGEALGVRGQWVESAGAWGVEVDPYNANQVFGWAAEWADLDHDTDLDGLALMGRWNANTFTEPQTDALWEQVEPLQFVQSAQEPRWGQADEGAARGLALADLNGDGWLDIVKRQLLGPTLIDASRCGTALWMSVTLHQPGPNTRGIGARLRVRTESRPIWQTRWLTAGGSGMYGGGPPTAWFGLGDSTEDATLEVRWPDGHTEVFEGVQTGRHVSLTRL